jgi:hypothetical protein
MRSRPPQRLRAHDGEPERYGRERVRHDDPAQLIQDQVPGSRQLFQARGYRRHVTGKPLGEITHLRRAPALSKRPVDSQP